MNGVTFKCLKCILPNSLLAFKSLAFVHDAGTALTLWIVDVTLEIRVNVLDQECEMGAV